MAALKKNTQIGSTNGVYRFICNHGDYFQPGIFGDEFCSSVAKLEGALGKLSDFNNTDKAKSNRALDISDLKKAYENFVSDIRSHEYTSSDAVRRTHEFNTMVLRELGYLAGANGANGVNGLSSTFGKPMGAEGSINEAGYSERFFLHDGKENANNTFVPVRHIIRENGKVKMLVMEMNHQLASGDEVPPGLFEQKYIYDFDKNGKPQSSDQQEYNKSMWQSLFHYVDEPSVIEEVYRIDPSIINEAVTRIFLEPEENRPKYILLLSGNVIYLLDESRWHQAAYAEIDLEVFFSEWAKGTKHKEESCALFEFLLAKKYLCREGEETLPAKIQEEGFKNAAGVTTNLKNGVIQVIEKIANEAKDYFGDQIDTWNAEDPDFTSKLRDDCLVYVYRLLFILYVGSRDEFGIFPVPDGYEKEHYDLTIGTFKDGYSFEKLRDLEQIPLRSEASCKGFFIDDTVKILFKMLDRKSDLNKDSVVFQVSKIDSQLFDDNEFNYLANLRIKNSTWQEIIRELSLQSTGNGKSKRMSRISYRNLGINQLGSVYESLLSYRLIYADEDLIEVFSPKTPEVTYLTPYRNRSIYKDNEVKRVRDYIDNDDRASSEHDVIYKKGEFVYRLNGLDRQKSASYYTPEILTRTVVKYTLKNIFERIDKNPEDYTELLRLKILEPAMGAGAFLNEVINQLATKYLEYDQKVTGVRIAPSEYYSKLQNIKYFIASSNVYGVDLNPTAVELGKLSLWLNVLGRASGKAIAEVPFFGHHLAVGNATIGAWFKVYRRDEVIAYEVAGKTPSAKKKVIGRAWWEKAPKLVKFARTKQKPNYFRVERKHSDDKSEKHNDEIYSFLLPMDGMFGALDCSKELKEKYSDGKTAMQELQKDWKAPLSNLQFDRLLRISERIDELLGDYARKISSVEFINNKAIRDREKPKGGDYMFGEYENLEKIKLMKGARNLDDMESEFSRLRLVLDYWCALWFADFDDVKFLPKRDEYWHDIESILGMDLWDNIEDVVQDCPLWDNNNNTIDAESQDDSTESQDDNVESQDDGAENEERQVIDEDSDNKDLYSKDELSKFSESTSSTGLPISDERYKFIKKRATEQRFFHPMLEFLEVFWSRSGFDVICGNPPWVKYTFDEGAVVSTVAPEIYVKGKTAPQIHKLRNELSNDNASLLKALEGEEIGAANGAGFMNAMCNYPLLQGQQCDLYKCVVENSFDYLSPLGFAGIVHPTSLLSDAKGQAFRKILYRHLENLFIFKNEKKLFADIAVRIEYAANIYRGKNKKPDFNMIADLFYPTTIDDCFNHDGRGKCPGLKDDSDSWNISGHRERIIQVNEQSLLAMARAFEGSNAWDTTSLISLHSVQALRILERFGAVKQRVGDLKNKTSADFSFPTPLDNTYAVRDGIIAPLPGDETVPADIEKYQLVLTGPLFHVGNPLFKNARHTCVVKSDYDPINLNKIDNDFVQNTKYLPQIPVSELKAMFKGFVVGNDLKGKEVFNSALDYYSVCFRAMTNPANERTLISAIIPPKISCIHAVKPLVFKKLDVCVLFASCVHSVVMDYWTKIMGTTFIQRITEKLPVLNGIDLFLKNELIKRTLLLNCLTVQYLPLWQEVYSETFRKNTWSLNDIRLKDTSKLAPEWNYNVPLRNAFERRMALVEIDVLVAMAMNFTLDDLLFMYDSQFPVLKQNEDATWYDANGNIIYTANKGLVGTGLDSQTFNRDKEKIFSLQPRETYEYIVTNNEMYNGQKDIYYAPFDKCDRVEDYKRAWAHFEKLLAAKKANVADNVEAE